MRYRLYYNNSQDPQRWSIDEGDSSTEITVMKLFLQGVYAESFTIEGDMQPRAFFIVDGTLRLEAGVAIFEPNRS